MSAGTIIWWQENIEQVAQVSPSSVSLCSFFISFLFRFSHPKQCKTKAKHSWGFVHIPAITHTEHQHTSQQQGCFFPLFPPHIKACCCSYTQAKLIFSRHLSWLPTRHLLWLPSHSHVQLSQTKRLLQVPRDKGIQAPKRKKSWCFSLSQQLMKR